ncbi:uncharacterized protein LOC128392870 [Panonychus citri]|uniref:uncharacterized protein LOC128392870 n=1 Tax=Panonychus citri TaxID=50023 RepID=UPI002307B8F9|nr:uncharacterized protein LOC128392870 [Panonychus citri]
MNSEQNSSFLSLNTDYLKSKLCISKVIIIIFALISISLLSPKYQLFYVTNQYLFLYAINWIQLYTITIMLICCLFSTNTSSLLVQTSIEYVYHIISMFMYLAISSWSFSWLNYNEDTTYLFAAIFALLNSFVHAAHGYFSILLR